MPPHSNKNTMKLRRLMCSLIATLSLAVFQYAQPPLPGPAGRDAGHPSGQSEDTVIRVNSNLVSVPVTVIDNAGRPVRNLPAGEFLIEENGHPETLARIAEPGQMPIELALLLDDSGSVRPQFEFERQAAIRFLRKVLKPEDRYSIFSIGPQPALVQHRTDNIEEGLKSLAAIPPSSGATAFYDSVVMAAHSLDRIRIPGVRRVQVVLSDGEDNNSEACSLDEALRAVLRTECIFYSINPGGRSIRLNRISIAGQDVLSRLAEQTGGWAFVSENLEDLNPIFDRIAAELRAQYLLEYYSSDPRHDGAYRRITVRLPNRPGLRIHARQGYYAAQG